MNEEKLKEENKKIVESESLFLTVYLAGYSEEYFYRNFVEKNYSDKINILNPMSVTHKQVIEQIGMNEYDTYIVRRDKKMILSSDLIIIYLSNNSPSFGTTMEIMFAYDHGVPVYVIDVTPEMKHANNAWVKFHTKKSFDSIENCFNFILNKKD